MARRRGCALGPPEVPIHRVNAFQRLLRYATPYRTRLVWAIAAMLVYAGGSMYLASLIKPIFDQVLPKRELLLYTSLAILGAYVLKGILRSKQGGHPMTGRTLGKQSNKIRYYAVHRGFTVPAGERTLRRLIPAMALEKAVSEMVRDLLIRAPDLRGVVAYSSRQNSRHLR